MKLASHIFLVIKLLSKQGSTTQHCCTFYGPSTFPGPFVNITSLRLIEHTPLWYTLIKVEYMQVIIFLSLALAARLFSLWSDAHAAKPDRKSVV